MSINHKEYRDRRDQVSATNYGLSIPNSHSNRRPLSFRSVLFAFYAVKSAHRTQSKPVQPLKKCGSPNQGKNHSDLTNPIPKNNPSFTASPLSSMRLNPPLSFAMIPLPRIPLPNFPVQPPENRPGIARHHRPELQNVSWAQKPHCPYALIPPISVPMLARVLSAAVNGIEAFPVEVEVEFRLGDTLVVIVGLPDAAVKESRDRVSTAITNSGFKFPMGRTTINLAPADVKKEGPSFDFPIAVGCWRRATNCKPINWTILSWSGNWR